MSPAIIGSSTHRVTEPINLDDDAESSSDETLISDETDFIDLTTTLIHAAQDLTNNGSDLNPSLFQKLDEVLHNGTHIRPKKTVELTDDSFLKVTSIVHHLQSGRTYLRGHLFRRSREIDDMLEKKTNEVAWITSPNDQNKSINEVEIEKVVKLRQLLLTNRSYPFGSYRDNVRTKDVPLLSLQDNERLCCRWKFVQVTRSEGSLERLKIDECNAGYGYDGRALRGAFRGETITGGASPAAASGEVCFNRAERKRCHFVDLFHFYELDVHASRQRYTFGDAFCGAGGASRGAKAAGLHVRWGLDHDSAAINSFRLNFEGCNCYHASSDIFSVTLLDDFTVEILHISPPCQPFSPAHTREGKCDEANQATLFAVAGIIRQAKPRIVTLEETFGLTHQSNAAWFRQLIHMLTTLEFSVKWKVFNLAEYGLPQPRKRLFIFASCPGEALPDFPEPTHYNPSGPRKPGISPFMTINRAISQIPRDVELHNPSAPELRRQERAYDGDVPFPHTITCSGGSKLHPSGLRNFTLREFACLQGFPLEHRFGNGARKQIGNAVPPVVAKVFFEAVIQALKKADGLL